MARQSIVFVPHYNLNFDYRTARKYGELEFGIKADFIGEPEFDAGISKLIREFMRDYDPEVDKILVSGSPTVCMYALGVVTDEHGGPITVLRYEREDRSYREVSFEY